MTLDDLLLTHLQCKFSSHLDVLNTKRSLLILNPKSLSSWHVILFKYSQSRASFMPVVNCLSFITHLSLISEIVHHLGSSGLLDRTKRWDHHYVAKRPKPLSRCVVVSVCKISHPDLLSDDPCELLT